MEALKALKEKMKSEAKVASAGKKYVTKAELEAAKLLKVREEEERERQEKLRKRKLAGEEAEESAAKQSKADQEEEKELPKLSKDEVIRRLRALGQPKTLFGEDEYSRLKRLLKAEKEMKLEDDAVGGQQANLMLELQRADKEERYRLKAVERERAKIAAEIGKEEKAAEKEEARAGASRENGDAEASALIETEDPTMAAFKRAAAALAEKRTVDAMTVDQKIAHWLQKWSKEWGEDLESRPEEVQKSGSGYQASLTYRQTMKYLEPLYERLKSKILHDELRTGLWMMVQAMCDRNYLHANDVYLRLAIGTSPWPIGVTQVGIHERSAREKISHSMNASGSAHIMNDEATRKFLQAMKRLITFVQRAYPTDPSRSIDFQRQADLGRGVAGGGSDHMALMEAEAKGETWQQLGLPQAPHIMDEKDGTVRIPPKWANVLQRAADDIKQSDESTAKAGRSEK